MDVVVATTVRERLPLPSLDQLALAACSGDDGAPGPPGPQGLIGPPPSPLTININNAETVIATISEASIDGAPSIVFLLEDENGTPVMGLPASAFGVSLAKLRPGSDGIGLGNQWLDDNVSVVRLSFVYNVN